MAECSTIPVQDNHQLLVKICHPWTWRIANVFMAVFFSLAAYVQVSVFVCQHKMRNFIPSVSIDPLNSLSHNLAVVLLIIETASKIRVEVESKKMMTCVHKKKIYFVNVFRWLVEFRNRIEGIGHQAWFRFGMRWRREVRRGIGGTLKKIEDIATHSNVVLIIVIYHLRCKLQQLTCIRSATLLQLTRW